MQTTSKNSPARLYGAARAAVSHDQGIGVVMVGGDLARCDVVPLLTGVQADLAGADVSAIVANYAGAAMLLSARGMTAGAAEARQGGFRASRPTAIVVAECDLDLARLYCDLQGRRGILRHAFTCHQAAHRWAVDQAALWAAQVRFHARAQSRR